MDIATIRLSRANYDLILIVPDLDINLFISNNLYQIFINFTCMIIATQHCFWIRTLMVSRFAYERALCALCANLRLSVTKTQISIQCTLVCYIPS